jgi:hypothetical protein
MVRNTAKLHCMLDLETYGKRPGCVIRSIGAAMFDPWDEPGQVGAQFYVNVERGGQERLGLHVDPDTEKWWSGKDMVEANAMLSENQLPVREAIDKFREFWREFTAKFVWGQGGNYDDPVMTAVLDRLGLPTPWKFYDANCTRTAYRMAGLDVFKVRRVGVAHHALHDAVHQIRCVQMAHAKIERR